MKAVDDDVPIAPVEYHKLSETTNGFFSVDKTYGIISNAKLLNNIGSRRPLITVQADDNSDQADTAGSTADATVKVGEASLSHVSVCLSDCLAFCLMSLSACLSVCLSFSLFLSGVEGGRERDRERERMCVCV